MEKCLKTVRRNCILDITHANSYFGESKKQILNKGDTKFSDDINHSMLNLDAYIHITSPIRRLVDLLNMIEFQRVKGILTLSNSALDFYRKWSDKLDFINACTKNIRKVQNECDLLHLCSNNLTVMQKEYDGYLFNKNETQCTVFIPDLKLTSRIPVNQDIAEFSCHKFRLFLFRNEENFKQKIRLQLQLF